MKPRLVVLAGPTAAGKSALALALAEKVGAHILVADSRQVYRGMNVGAAKASAPDRARVPHHGLDVADVTGSFDAARFREHAAGVISELHARGVPVVVEGGTGLYLRALIRGLMDLPGRDDAFRADLTAEAASVGWPALHARLALADADYAARIATTDPVRITRALEVLALTGIPFSQHESAHAFREQAYEVLGFVVDIPREPHHARVKARVQAMWDGGLLEETRALMAALPAGHPLLETINYAQAAAHLRGEITAQQAREDMVLRTVQFAKRQRTWFRKEAWLSPLPAAADLESAVRAFLAR